jgi:hypothetical protein
MKSKLDGLAKEIKSLKKEYVNNPSTNGSFLDKSLMHRSVSPKTVGSFKFFKNEKKLPTMTKTSTHLIGVM